MRERFAALYGEQPRLFRAPGRVNLIGEHTDYNDGFVMPAALQFATTVAAAPRTDGRLVVRSLNLEEEIGYSLDDDSRSGGHHWSDYVRGVAFACRAAGLELRGATLLLHGDVPLGSGLSSSASLEVAAALALLTLAGLELPRPELARLCQQAENDFVGMRCGIMDQFISCCGKAGHALRLDCRSLEYTLVPVAGASLVICNSGVKHALASGEYNQRRTACEEGARLLGVRALRDVDLAQVESLPAELVPLCRHVVSENARVEDGAAALARGDLHTFGQLMRASHRSLRDDYRVSCQELDLLVDLALGCPGVYGARMTGGGFGGCTVNLVRPEAVDDFQRVLGESYARVVGRAPEVYVCQPGDGAKEIL